MRRFFATLVLAATPLIFVSAPQGLRVVQHQRVEYSASSARFAIARAQGHSNGTNEASAWSDTFTSSVGTGSVVVAAMAHFNGTGSADPVCTLGGVPMTQAIEEEAGVTVAIHYIENVSGSPTVVSCTLIGVGAAADAMELWELSGAATSSSLDSSGHEASVSATDHSTSLGTATTNGFAICAISNGSGNGGAGAGWTLRQEAGAVASTVFEDQAVSAGAVTCADAGSHGSWSARMAGIVIKEAGGGAASPLPAMVGQARGGGWWPWSLR